MQHDNIQNKFHFGLAPSPKSTQGIGPISSLIYFISIVVFYLSAYKVSVIILKINQVIAKLMYLTFDPA